MSKKLKWKNTRMKGKKLSTETVKKMSDSHTWDRSPNWKWDCVWYSCLHRRVKKWKWKPMRCDNCGSIDAKKYEWANIDHKYNRILDDYIQMCTTCHRKYDYTKFWIPTNMWGRNIKIVK